MEALFQEFPVSFSGARFVYAVRSPDSPGVDWRVQVRKLPFISWNLPVGMLKLFEQHQKQLLLRELRINQREWHHMKRKIPGGEPWILPFVRHG